jgi:exopolysaccharide biosynthesis polyprenyl glycosylphosphotransferase
LKTRDSNDALAAVLALVADALFIWAGGMAAVWLRFDSGWLPLPFGRDHDLYTRYARAMAAVLPVYLLVFDALRLYSRPQQGTFANRIPRLVRACGVATLAVLVVNSLLKNIAAYSNGAILVGFATIVPCVLLERGILFHVELRLARLAAPIHRTLIVGASEVAIRLIRALERDPRLRTRVVGVLTVPDEPADPALPADRRLGELDSLEETVRSRGVDQLIVTGHHLDHDTIVRLLLFCEQHLVHFNVVPDLFRLLTASVAVHTIDDVPLLGVSRWPLDHYWNRLLKRAEDVVGALVGLVLSAPAIAAAAVLIRRESPGPVFYRQERCGERGRVFRLCKLRTMRPDAEAGGAAPGWTVANDPRRTRIGAWLRRYNVDELPQFWNVLRGDMSLVGPRPERPYFVEQFKDDVQHYMWRHVSRPGMTGWAQVNGLRGDTSIRERVRYDLYYLENWSLAFDLKILIRTCFSRAQA